MPRKKQLSPDKLARTLSIPSGYASLKLGMNLNPKQKEVLDAIFCNPTKTRTILRAANGVGKTSVIICASVLYAMEMKNAMVISTAAVYRQIKEQLMSCLKSYAHLYPTWEFKDASVSINGINKYIGFSTDDEATAQGFHSKEGQPLFIIVDEAAGVPDSIFRAFDRCQPTWLLLCGSPLDNAGFFYEAETNSAIYKHFRHFKISQYDCLKSDGWWISENDIDLMIAKWGKDHPLVLSSVYADFADNNTEGVITLRAYDYCLKNPPPYIENKNIRRVGIDFAAGRNESVIALLYGNRVSLVKCWRNKDTMATVGQIIIELERLKQEIGLNASEVYADADGLGLPLVHRIRELGWPINAFHGGSGPMNDEYKNRIAEIWIDTARKIQRCEIIIPDDSILKMQFLSRKQKINSTGKLQLESKENMLDRGVDSPDRSDAVCMAIGEPYTGLVTFAKQINATPLNYVGMFR